MASRFWVGGTGTWDGSDTTHWAATSNGAGGASVPGSSDTVTLDGSSGGGTITVNTNFTIVSLTATNHTGTLDFSANNNTVTISGDSPAFNYNGSAARTLTLGSATITLSGNNAVLDVSGTTISFSGASSNIRFTSTAAGNRLIFGNRTFGTITAGGAAAPYLSFFGGCTIATFALTAPVNIKFNGSSTVTITNALSIASSSGTAPSLFTSGTLGTAATISSANSATLASMALRDMTFTGGGTFAANNSLDCGNNSGITITAPSAGGPVGQQCQ